jgi:hypothetical protein
MRSTFIVVAVLVGCGDVKDGPSDAPAGTDDAAPDAAPDAATCPKTLLLGGTAVEPQGWSVIMQAPASLTYGSDYVRLDTSTLAGASTGGQLLLHYPGALPAPPFRLQAVLLVERVNPHNELDAAVALMGSFTPPFGNGNDRSQIIYLDGGSIGWADGTQALATTITNNAYHTVELAVDASGTARVTIDGVDALMRSGFVSSRAIAIGDQTNDRSVDSAIRIRSITLPCL